MAKFTFADGSVFEGTVEELAEYARLAGGAEPSQEIEGPVRVGDTIEITDSVNFPTGSRYVVESVDGAGKPGFNDVRLYHSKYRIVARKEEASEPAKSLPVDGDYVVFDESCCDITAGKPYKVEIRDVYDFAVIDDGGERNYFDEEDEYRIITDARELAFAKAGRKLDEFKAGDIVRASISGKIIEVTGIDNHKEHSVRFIHEVYGDNGYNPKALELIAPAEARVDAE